MKFMPVEWVVSASALIVVVIILRGLLGKRISAGLRYGLWSVVLVRLLLPVSVFLTMTVPQLPTWTPPESMREESIYVLPVGIAPLEDSGVHVREDGALGDTSSFGYPQLTGDGAHVVRYANKISPLELLGAVWVVGAVIFGAALLAANLRFFIRLRQVRRPLGGTSAPVPVYVASALPSPCLMGLLKPSVYVTEEAAADPVMLRHVLAHELTHYNHLDHLWSILRGLALAMHWWNPLVWLAVAYSRRDGELACDEGALERLGDGERIAYGETLLSLVTAKARPSDLFSFATTMTGGKRSLRERIQRIVCQPKQLVGAVIAVALVLTLSVLLAFGQSRDAEASDAPEDVSREAPEASTNRPDNAWMTAKITVNKEGVPYIDYEYGNTKEFLNGEPIPAPRSWADEDLAGRNKMQYLENSSEVWAKLVSPTDGWLVACYGRGVAATDTYVYKTTDGGMTWTEAASNPAVSWHIADVGFLSPDRLIVAQRLFDGAPCFITKDGGETWEEIGLPDQQQVLSVICNNSIGVVMMQFGAHENDQPAGYMLSRDAGDTWTVSYQESRTIQADLDHDGIPEDLNLNRSGDENQQMWTLFWLSQTKADGEPYHYYWVDHAGTHHVLWTSFYLCQLDGADYLLKYSPWMGGGSCEYRYKLFYLTPEGEEVAVQQNSLEFDLIFDSDYASQHQYDPWAINAFMDEINTLLANSTLILNTDPNLEETFQQEGRLYDSLWWLDKAQDENATMLDNLLSYANYAQDHPDDVWSPLADLLQNLTEQQIQLPSDTGGVTPANLVRMLRDAERGSRFYTRNNFQAGDPGVEDYKRWDVLLTDGSCLRLFASKSSESRNVLMVLETSDGTWSAYYDAPELYEVIININ